MFNWVKSGEESQGLKPAVALQYQKCLAAFPVPASVPALHVIALDVTVYLLLNYKGVYSNLS